MNVKFLINAGLVDLTNHFSLFFQAWKGNQLIPNVNLVMYSLIKTQGYIFIEFRDFIRAVQCFKSLKNYCKYWKDIQLEIWSLEALAQTYKLSGFYDQSIYYLHKALKLVWQKQDRDSELRIYDLLATSYYYEGAID